MKKLSFIIAALFLMSIALSHVGCKTGTQEGSSGGAPPAKAAGDGKAKGKSKGPRIPSHEEYLAMYDRNGDGEVTLEEFIEGPMGPPAGEK